MSAQEWGIVIAVAMSGVLTLAPWMLMVHTKLAVIATQIAELSQQVARAADAHQELWLLSAEHETRLQTNYVQLAHLAERLREL